MKFKIILGSMKGVLFVFCFFLIILITYFYQSYFLKQQTIIRLRDDSNKITVYRQWGLNINEFENMYAYFIKETDSLLFVIFPFRAQYIQQKHDNILRLVQARYATEVTKQRELVQSRLIYLRERVKNDTSLTQASKSNYFDIFEIVAGEVFEKNSDITIAKKELKKLEELDGEITKQVEDIRKESIVHELQTYRSTCEELRIYFNEKVNSAQQKNAEDCIAAAEKLMGPGYVQNGADFMATLSRERVFKLVQEVSQAKQQAMQEEQYALLVQKKEEERLTVVPPSPRQEGKVIVVNLSLQRLYAYENGVSIFTFAVPITTGKYGFETVTGEFAIYLKAQQHQMQSPFPGIYYDDVVNYWMPFYLGYGLHDAPWRSVYGTQDYGAVGSHGCVNMPLKDASILYNWAEVGTRVIVL